MVKMFLCEIETVNNMNEVTIMKRETMMMKMMEIKKRKKTRMMDRRDSNTCLVLASRSVLKCCVYLPASSLLCPSFQFEAVVSCLRNHLLSSEMEMIRKRMMKKRMMRKRMMRKRMMRKVRDGLYEC